MQKLPRQALIHSDCGKALWIMVYAMACADENYMPSAKFQLDTALKKGKVDKTLCYNIADMDKEFTEKNNKILSSGEGRRRGYYLWKPYFVNKALLELRQGDYLIYLDSAGFYYRSNVAPIVSYMGRKNIDMIGSRRNGYLEKHWTKRDVFVYMKCDTHFNKTFFNLKHSSSMQLRLYPPN